MLEAHYIDEQIHDEDIMDRNTAIKRQAVSAAAIVWTNSNFLNECVIQWPIFPSG